MDPARHRLRRRHHAYYADMDPAPRRRRRRLARRLGRSYHRGRRDESEKRTYKGRSRLSYRGSRGGHLTYSSPRRSWPDDSRGHSKASKLGWRRRKSTRRRRRDPESMYDYDASYASGDPARRHRRRRRARSWPDDSRGHAKASKLGWRRRRRGRKKARRDMERSWPGHSREHARAAHEGWSRVGGPGWRPKRPTYSGPRARRTRGFYSAAYGSRYRRDSDYGRSWPDDSRGHSRASKLGWRRRRRSSRRRDY
jgi:hypothetical protein